MRCILTKSPSLILPSFLAFRVDRGIPIFSLSSSLSFSLFLFQFLFLSCVSVCRCLRMRAWVSGGWKSLVGARGWCREGGRPKAEMGRAVDRGDSREAAGCLAWGAFISPEVLNTKRGRELKKKPPRLYPTSDGLIKNLRGENNIGRLRRSLNPRLVLRDDFSDVNLSLAM